MVNTKSFPSYTDFLNLLGPSTELLAEDHFYDQLYSVERLEAYALTLTEELKLAPKGIRRGRSLRPELKRCEPALEKAYLTITEALQEKQSISPAAEWFVDNFHLIESNLREIKRSLPDDYYYGLPQIAGGQLKGYPRVYALALSFVSHTDSRLDPQALKRFVNAFQSKVPLEIGELWAIVITLRVVLIQHINVLAQRLITARDSREAADNMADELLSLVIKPNIQEKEIQNYISTKLGTAANFNRPFIVQLIQRLRDQDPRVWPAFEWIETELGKISTSTEKVTQLELHRQASAQITIGNIIGSLRLLSSHDWRDFIESVNLVDPILKKDPAGAYEAMDFTTRDQYRHVLEAISRKSKLSEMEVGQKAILLSQHATPGSHAHHVGYYLVGDGQQELKKICEYNPSLFERFKRTFSFHPTLIYLSLITLLTLAFYVPLQIYFNKLETALWLQITFAIVALLPASEIALSFINHYITYFIKPRALPRIDTEKGIPTDAQTMVVIPTLFTKVKGVQELVERLEIHYLSNQDPVLTFALLGDFADAPTEKVETDELLLKVAIEGIQNLNDRYCPNSEAKFHLFLRKRLFNKSEGSWIGWERKRGKLLEFNKLLRGAQDTSYTYVSADQELLSSIKYVITLDSDSQLPRDAAQKLVGTILHPLNRPYFDRIKGRVTKGYGILQPRVSITTSSAQETRFARISSGNIGIDPYTTAVSDVYQDLFREGSFTGKGLYVVDAFEQAMKHRVPENAVLSHDLYEGSFARSALVTDVELFDDYPGDFETYSKRGHRWTRGDWQILPWLLPWVKNDQGKRVKNDLSIISRWKIFDNLRRSVVPVATLIWLLLAWTILPGSPAMWTSLIMLMFLFPVYSTVATGEWMRRRGLTWEGHFLGGVREFKIKTSQILLTIAFLAKQAWTQVDAIARVFYRMNFSKKKMLEWTSFAQLSSESSTHVNIKSFFDPGPVIGILCALGIYYFKPHAFPVAAPFLILWIFNPAIKKWLATSPQEKKDQLTNIELKEFRTYARATWHFFETFVTKGDNYLAPDNFQEDPKPVVAHRTSPTNMGLHLMAEVSAYDLGYIGKATVITDLEKTFETLEKLPHMHGHFFNWYDTKSLLPLEPKYISTVDSGNLAGHLLTLKQFLLEVKKTKVSYDVLRKGLIDTLDIIFEEISQIQDQTPGAGIASAKQLLKNTASILSRVNKAPVKTVEDWSALLYYLEKELNYTFDVLEALSIESRAQGIDFNRTLGWINGGVKQVSSLIQDLKVSNDEIVSKLESLSERANTLALRMDFRFLFDEKRKLFVIGYNVNDSRFDNSYYDLLASESRLASFVAIAKGDIPQEHWFRLGRQMAPVRGGRALIAWTATMFEYLMPLLVMKRYDDTLLDQTYLAVVGRQIDYGVEKNVPWGVSEAGYNARDLNMNYQYGPFGIPGLGLKRGLSDELVVSPYSTMLGALIAPRAALQNLRHLTRLGALARYGFYESLDFTAERLPSKQKYVILKSYMAHHQGMSLVAMNNILNDSVMQKRFHNEPLVLATELLLQERIPQIVALSQPRSEEIKSDGFLHSSTDFHPRLYSDVNLSLPRTQLLSNGTYSVMVTSTGAGYSRCGQLNVTRWREDGTRDHWGQFYYVRNKISGSHWSATHQPTRKSPQSFGATFSEDKVEYWRKDEECLTKTEIIVSPEDNVEMRRITLTNDSKTLQEYEVTSFMEAVLAKPNDDTAHPAFSNLFVQTEFISNGSALIGTRRKRSNKENPPWGFHTVSSDSTIIGAVQYETDRSRFIGRGRSARDPIVIEENRPLSSSVGSVLDPAFSLRVTVKVEPGKSAMVTFTTGLVYSRDEALTLIDKYRDPSIFKREAEMAWTQAQVQLRHMNITNAKAHTYQRLAGRVIYLDSSLRPSSHVLSLNTRAQSNLWAYGISGDLPIVLTQISDEKDMELVRELLHAHEYLRLKGLSIDLVILNEHAPSYLQTLSDEIARQIRMSGSLALLDKPGGVFVRRTDLIPPEDVTLLRTVARVILSAEKGDLEEQLKHRKHRSVAPEALVPKMAQPTFTKTLPETKDWKLKFFNGLGGFTQDDREYVIHLKDGQWTPAPWINVIANSKDFGCIITETGSGYTWAENSRENRITPWSNDPVSDPPGEVIYLRDEETGVYWSPTPLPIRQEVDYNIHHGQGYTRFHHVSQNLEQELEIFVSQEDTVKFSRLKIKNLGDEERKLSVTSYLEWVLGFHRGTSAAYIIPEYDEETGMIYARNPYNNEFASRISFVAISEDETTYTCDRREFLGRNGSPGDPASMKRTHLAGTTGAGLDPCAAFQSKFDLGPNGEKTVVVILGSANSVEEARVLVKKHRSLESAETAINESIRFWDKTVSTLTIKTPDESMNTLVNRWLLYQTLSCRVWARSAFYQSGGAFGFRDQLQDVMALVYSHPDISRAQILTSAARQFKEGDVQHWWHPPTGRGVRTHFSDDLIWLPFVVSHYIKVSGDKNILNELVPFIEAPLLAPGQEDSYTHPYVSEEKGSIFEHCARTLDRSLKVGAHGLPLMGAGDWNDGMSRVGHEGKGESVWVAWFLYSTLTQFIPYCESMGDTKRAEAYKKHLEHLKKAIEEKAWDGDWYRRAYFDDGTPLGSSQNEECRIDSISNSWAVLSGAGDKNRVVKAMNAVDEYLIHRGDGLIKLFTPPFDKTPLDPGYIKGYVPGVRENGGQYTHAAIWTLMAYAELGQGNKAHELYALLNPINHSSTRAGLHKYKVEPYVVAADIYGLHPHIGRGGWTWYTGSASWMYRAAMESIIGIKLEGDTLSFNPKVPESWREFEVSYLYQDTTYKVTLIQGVGISKSEAIKLVNDKTTHEVKFYF